jgi:hypothetical protein
LWCIKTASLVTRVTPDFSFAEAPNCPLAVRGGQPCPVVLRALHGGGHPASVDEVVPLEGREAPVAGQGHDGEDVVAGLDAVPGDRAPEVVHEAMNSSGTTRPSPFLLSESTIRRPRSTHDQRSPCTFSRRQPVS